MDLANDQEQALRQVAARSGRQEHLLFLYAIQGAWEPFHAVGRGAAQDRPDDALVYEILGLGQRPERAGGALEAIQQQDARPVLFYSLAKSFLGRDDYKTALLVAKALVERDKNETLPLNLVAKYLAVRAERALALQVIERSLRLNPQQQDMVFLQEALAKGEGADLDLHLDPVPRQMGVTFYVPVYNGEAYLRETIESLLTQDYPLHEVLVIDDGSTDGTRAIAREYPVRLIAFGENRGLAAGRNAAFREAATPLVGAVDGDVCPDPDYTTHILMEFENASGRLAGVGGRLIESHTCTPADQWRARHLPQGWYPVRMYCGSPLADQAHDAPFCSFFFLNGCNTVFRRELVLKAGGYNEKYRTNAEDSALGIALRSQGYHLAFTRGAVARHMRRDTVQSVLKTAWNYGFWARQEGGIYTDPATTLANLGYAVHTAFGKLSGDLSAGSIRDAYLDFLLLFHWMLLDIRHCMRQGLLTNGQAADLQGMVLRPVDALDRRFGGRLGDRVRTDSAHLLVSAEPDAEPAPDDLKAVLEQFLHGVTEELETWPGWLYSALAGTQARR